MQMFLLLFAELVWSLQFLMCTALLLAKCYWKSLGLRLCNLCICRKKQGVGRSQKSLDCCSSIGMHWALLPDLNCLQPVLITDILVCIFHFLQEDNFTGIIILSFSISLSAPNSIVSGFVLYILFVWHGYMQGGYHCVSHWFSVCCLQPSHNS